MIVASARLLDGVRNCFVGVGLPNIVCNLAQRTVAPELQLVYESGVFGARPRRLPLSIGDPTLATGSTAVTSMFELFAFYLQAGLIDVAFLGGAQIDRFGNLNTTVIGSYGRPKVRLPGSGGACEIAIHARKILVIMRQARRSFVERLDFRTSPGHSGNPAHDRARGWFGSGPTTVVTDLGTYGFDEQTGEMTLLTVHPGVALGEVEENTGWKLRVSESIGETPRPTDEELRLIRMQLDDARIYPVSGGSEAVETALKLARSYHLARGEDERTAVIGRRSSYHGNTIGTLDVGGKELLRAPYAPWLGRFRHVEPAYEYRCANPNHPAGCGSRHAEQLDRTIIEIGPSNVAAFIAEPVAGATLAAAVPTDDYWPAIVEVCRRHGALVIADEVMTGFGRTGRWFGVDHWDVRPDLVAAGKGTTGGYVPFGFAAASGEVFETILEGGGFVHGFTWSHHALGAAAGLAVFRELKNGLVDRSRDLGDRLLRDLRQALNGAPSVGDVRGLGTMIGIELVKDLETKEPFDRSERVTERVVDAAREAGLLLYSSTFHVDGTNGDLLML